MLLFLSTPSVRRATSWLLLSILMLLFLSTPSVRRATINHNANHKRAKFLSTPSVRRATQTNRLHAATIQISIHALRAEGDDTDAGDPQDTTQFLSTPSVRRATRLVVTCTGSGVISIHALRAEGDTLIITQTIKEPNFYPRPPCGGRRLVYGNRYGNAGFLSTPSVRRATFWRQHSANRKKISIHALRAEGDAVRLSNLPRAV